MASARARFALAVALAVSSGGAAAEAAEAGSVFLRVLREQPQAARSERPLVVSGWFTHRSFSAEDATNVRLFGPAGDIPLFIDGEGLVREFGEIVAARLVFVLPPGTEHGAEFELAWGPQVFGPTAVVEGFDPSAAADMEPASFELIEPEAGLVDGQDYAASIQVIADSSAEYHFWWYLLPMCAIFAVLTVRKFKASDKAA